jgi:hypothetical protein
LSYSFSLPLNCFFGCCTASCYSEQYMALLPTRIFLGPMGNLWFRSAVASTLVCCSSSMEGFPWCFVRSSGIVVVCSYSLDMIVCWLIVTGGWLWAALIHWCCAGSLFCFFRCRGVWPCVGGVGLRVRRLCFTRLVALMRVPGCFFLPEWCGGE